MLIYFCERNGFVITSTWFKKPNRRSYTWKAAGDGILHQLVCLRVKHQFRYGIKQDVQTLPTADVDSDHSLLVCKDVHQIEEYVPKGKTEMQFADVITQQQKMQTRRLSTQYTDFCREVTKKVFPRCDIRKCVIYVVCYHVCGKVEEWRCNET